MLEPLYTKSPTFTRKESEVDLVDPHDKPDPDPENTKPVSAHHHGIMVVRLCV